MDVRKKNSYLLLGALLLILGYAFYMLIRDPGSTYLNLISFGRWNSLFTLRTAVEWRWVDSVPSFLHTAAFSFISFGLLKRLSRSAFIIPLFWLTANLGFEFTQRYSGLGYFDWNDVLASLAGCIFVIVVLFAIRRKDVPHKSSTLSCTFSLLRTALEISIVGAGFLSIVATSPQLEGRYKPVYMSYEELRQPISREEPADLTELGKIYVYGNYLLVNTPNKGIHIFDNADPTKPVNLVFLDIPGNVDIAVKDNVLYADSYIDLVAFDLQDMDDVQEIKRIENVFPYDPYQGIPEDIYFYHYSEEKGVIVGYTQTQEQSTGGSADE